MSRNLTLSRLLNLLLVLMIIYLSVPRAFEEQIKIDEVSSIEYIFVYENTSEMTRERVVFTSYYTNDNYSSSNTTSSGLTTSDFGINQHGWYTFRGRVVIAVATTLCIEVKSGACGKYSEYKDTHHYFELYDTLDIKILGETYPAIVLDSCGACNWDEEYQRVDIFVSNKKYSVGKVKGSIRYAD